jgi:hypothetical protein
MRHTVTGGCVVVKDTECFSGENEVKANNNTTARDKDGKCQTLIAGECLVLTDNSSKVVKTKAKDGEDTGDLTFIRASNSTCVTVKQTTQCYNDTVEDAKKVNKVSTLDKATNKCVYVLTAGECYDTTAEVSKVTTKDIHINNFSNCVALKATECFGEDKAVTSSSTIKRNKAGKCVYLSSTQCFDGEADGAVAITATSAAKKDGTCLKLKDTQCIEGDAAKEVSKTRVKKANSECLTLDAGKCWNVDAQTQDAVSSSSFLHPVTGLCVILAKNQC